jgi:hypothetical protein
MAGKRARIAAKSSVNGLAHCGRAVASESKARTWFWFTVTFVFAAITTYELAMIVADYRRYPVLTVVDVKTQKGGADFPTVIVCSHNPVPCRNLFPVSLTYPELWAASGCSAGMQIRGYVGDVISEYAEAQHAADGHGVERVPRKYLEHHDGNTDHPLMALWAYHNVELPGVRRMLEDDE